MADFVLIAANGVDAPVLAPVSPSNGQLDVATDLDHGSPMTSPAPLAPSAAAADNRNIVRRKLTGYVGFANLPNQWHRKSVRKGFNFNVMVVGTLAGVLLTILSLG